MLKKRIAANIVVRNGIVVQSIGFSKYLPVGKPNIAIEFLNQWGIDEIMLTDISATVNNKEPDYESIRQATKKCLVPLTIAGGINHIDQIKKLMQCGADKISLNSAAIKSPTLITEAAKIFGDQCVIVCIDAIKQDDNYKVYEHSTKSVLNITVGEWAAKCQELGAGEILIQSVDRDGKYSGFDIEMITSVCERVNIPVICSGGARTAADFIEVFEQTNVSAACAANMFHFTEHSVNLTKSIISKHIPVRLDTHADYLENAVDADCRIVKKTDEILEKMLYTRIENEII